METPVLEIPDIFAEEEKEMETDLPWNVILHNDDHHTVHEVVLQVQKATGVPLEAAFEITMEAHSKGRVVCYTGSYTRCEKVAAILKEIKLIVEIVQVEG